MRIVVQNQGDIAEIKTIINLYSDSISIDLGMIGEAVQVELDENDQPVKVYSLSSDFHVLHFSIQPLPDSKEETLIIFVAFAKRREPQSLDECIAQFVDRTKILEEILQSSN